MKAFVLTIVFSIISYIGIYGQPAHLVISQMNGAGGNNNALFTHDFVELYNPTATTISLSGLSLQYTTSSAASWSKVALIGSIKPGQYFLVQLGSGGTAGNALPTPDQTAGFGISATSGIIALVDNITTIEANTCPSSVIDLVGYGSSPLCKEGLPAGPPGPGESIWRLENGCADTDHNGVDFITGPASPRNSSSPAHSCGNGSVTISAVSMLPFCISNSSTVTGRVEYSGQGTFDQSIFRVYLSDVNGSFTASAVVGETSVSATNPMGSITVTIPPDLPSGTNYRMRIQVSNPSIYSTWSEPFQMISGAANSSGLSAIPSINGLVLSWTNPAGCFDEVMIVVKESSSISGSPSGDGSSYNADANFTGPGTVFDGGKVVYKGNAGVQALTGLDSYKVYYLKAFTRRGNSWSNGVEISDFPRFLPAPGEIVINQLSPDYGSASDEYVELVNTTDKTFYLTDLSFAYQSATGTSKISAFLTGILRPHRYWLLSPNASVTAGRTTGIIRDGSLNSGLALNAQIAIVRKADDVIVDAVAYGNVPAGDYIESSPAVAPPVDGGLKRTIEGLDDDNNRGDFSPVSNAEIELSNSNSLLANAGAVVTAGRFSKIYITGDASLAGTVSIAEKLVLVNGKLSLSEMNLSAKKIEGGHSKTYVKTNSTGMLQLDSIGLDQNTLPIGNSTFNPVRISAGGGLSWKVSVQDALLDISHNKAVQRTWQIIPSVPPASGANILLEYNDGDANQVTGSFNVNEDVYVWSNPTSIWEIAGFALRPSGKPGGIRTVSLMNANQFSSFVVTNVTGALPVHFAEEKLQLRGSEVLLSWSNLTENEIRVYEVERSADATVFSKFAEVAPVKNNGQAAHYNYVDNSQVSGRVYYRIKAVEQTGSVRYSKIVSLDTGERLPRLLIYPNPVLHGQVRMHTKNLPTGIYDLHIFNAAGQRILTEKIKHIKGWPDKIVFVNELRRGYYLIRLGGPMVLQQWFIIE